MPAAIANSAPMISHMLRRDFTGTDERGPLGTPISVLGNDGELSWGAPCVDGRSAGVAIFTGLRPCVDGDGGCRDRGGRLRPGFDIGGLLPAAVVVDEFVGAMLEDG